MLVENTIEEATLLRLELCNNFYKNHIMPLADFYDLAVGKKIDNLKINKKLLKKKKIIIIDDEKYTTILNNIIKKDSSYKKNILNDFNEIEKMKIDFKNNLNLK